MLAQAFAVVGAADPGLAATTIADSFLFSAPLRSFYGIDPLIHAVSLFSDGTYVSLVIRNGTNGSERNPSIFCLFSEYGRSGWGPFILNLLLISEQVEIRIRLIQMVSF